MDWSVVMMGAFAVWFLYQCYEACLPKREIARRERIKRAKRGIVMRPNWWYKHPDGTVVVSKTGRARDMEFIQKGPEWRPALWTERDQELAERDARGREYWQ